MAKGVREKMIDSAIALLATSGLNGTSFSTVLAHSGAPRGSIYHHFPDGKDQLVAAAIETAGARAIAAMARLEPASPVAVVESFGHLWRALLRDTHFAAGCSVLAVAVAGDSPELRAHARDVFRSWTADLTELLVRTGARRHDAESIATVLVAATEGAVVLSRAEQSTAPLDAVVGHLRDWVKALYPGG